MNGDENPCKFCRILQKFKIIKLDEDFQSGRENYEGWLQSVACLVKNEEIFDFSNVKKYPSNPPGTPSPIRDILYKLLPDSNELKNFKKNQSIRK